MRHLLELLGRLRRDEGGAFAVIFAVLAIVLVAMSGAVVDFTSMQQARTRAQVALDAAALSLQPDIYGTSASTLQTEAQKLLTDQLIQPNFAWNDCSSKTKSAPPCATVGLPVVDQTNGTLSLSATLKVPMNFVSMVGVTTLTASIVSVATRQKLNLEVAFVLDNSLSMAEESRMTDLKQATTCAVNILLDNNCNSTATATTVQNTSIAVVPFTNEVNVGTGNVGATWLDMAGAGTLSKTNFAKDDAGTPYGSTNHPLVNANGYFNGLSQSATAAKWGGCVVARVEPYDTDDTPPDPSSPDTLFTPYFAVDEPDSGGFSNTYMSDTPSQCNRTDGTCTTSKVASSSYNSVTQITTTTYTTTIKNNRGQTTAGPTTSVVTQTTGPSTANQSSSTTTGSVLTAANGDRNSSSGICSCNSGHTQSTNTTPGQVNKNTVNGTLPKDTSSTDRNGNVTTVHYVSVRVETDTQPVTAATTDTYTCTGVTYTPWKQGTANTTGGLTPRQMQERQCKYNGATPSGVSQSGDKGPNGDCPTNPIQSLTATKSLITTAIGKLNRRAGRISMPASNGASTCCRRAPRSPMAGPTTKPLPRSSS